MEKTQPKNKNKRRPRRTKPIITGWKLGQLLDYQTIKRLKEIVR